MTVSYTHLDVYKRQPAVLFTRAHLDASTESTALVEGWKPSHSANE